MFVKTPWHCPQLGLGCAQEGSRPRAPKFHSGPPTPGLVPSVIWEMEAEGMLTGLYWVSDILGSVARQEKCFLTPAFVYRHPSLGFQLWRYLWSFPDWLGATGIS